MREEPVRGLGGGGGGWGWFCPPPPAFRRGKNKFNCERKVDENDFYFRKEREKICSVKTPTSHSALVPSS